MCIAANEIEFAYKSFVSAEGFIEKNEFHMFCYSVCYGFWNQFTV